MVSTRSDGSISTATKATAEKRQRDDVHGLGRALAAEGAEQDEDEHADREDDLRQHGTESGNGEGGVHRDLSVRRQPPFSRCASAAS